MSLQGTAGINDHGVLGNTQANKHTLLCYQMHVVMWSVLDSAKVGPHSSMFPVHIGYMLDVLLQQRPANILATRHPYTSLIHVNQNGNTLFAHHNFSHSRHV